MALLFKVKVLLVFIIAAAVAMAAPLQAAPASGQVLLAPHRAIYDLRLSKSNANSGIDSIRGRILYDFSGNACGGYQLQFRHVSELASGEGKSTLNDMRSTTWEDAAATQFRFNSETLLDSRTVESVDGYAERRTSAVNVRLTKPRAKTLSFPAITVFPMEHVRLIILAAREGKTILEFPIFDGGETGDKLYNTLTVIGRPIAPHQNLPNDAAGKKTELANLMRWPVTVSYFDTMEKKSEQLGEQTPIYSISFEMYENGIARAPIFSYPEFSMVGEITSLDLGEVKPCP